MNTPKQSEPWEDVADALLINEGLGYTVSMPLPQARELMRERATRITASLIEYGWTPPSLPDRLDGE